MPEEIHTIAWPTPMWPAPSARLLRPDAHICVQPGDEAGPAIEPANAHWLDADSENRPA
ncbi:hypothetical protein [Verminephrobacter eiseniae]|uniref:hypothetical protein n=1 Tax=Verminephrobacter eiseniae TaxID=364317 RepID=UPI0022385FE3|nr:hypothetical protein [Verminephrobacter eiseniae]